jgi:hypothetical protein
LPFEASTLLYIEFSPFILCNVYMLIMLKTIINSHWTFNHYYMPLKVF